MLEITIESNELHKDNYEVFFGRIFKGDDATINGHKAITLTGDDANQVTVVPDPNDPTIQRIVIDAYPKSETDRRIFEAMGNPYEEIEKKCDYLYAVRYGNIDYQYAMEWFESHRSAAVGGACSVKSGNGLVGRNYDWLNDYQATFSVFTPRSEGRFAVMGNASYSGLTVQKVDGGQYSEDYKILPFFLQDGINEHGLFAEVNVVPRWGNDRVSPMITKRDSVCSVMLVRYILDHFQTVNEAVDYLRDYVEIYNPQGMIDLDYELHYYLKDATTRKVVEFVGGHVVVVESDILTNFHLYGTNIGSVGAYTPQTAIQGFFPTSQGIEQYGTGLERYNLLRNASAGDIEQMRTDMDSVKFSKAYTLESNEWFSDFVGGEIDVDTPADDTDFISRLNEYKQKWAERSKDDPQVWITCHSVIYDLDKKEMFVRVQEREDEYRFGFEQSGGATTYADLPDKPQIGGETLAGNKTAAQLGLQPIDVTIRIDETTTAEDFDNIVAALRNGSRLLAAIDRSGGDYDYAYHPTSVMSFDEERLHFYIFNALEKNISHVVAIREDGVQFLIEDYYLQEEIENLDEIESNAALGASIVPKVPAQASSTNQLADKAFVNSTVQTGTANFRGNWATLAAVPTDASLYPADYAGNHTPTVNDYMVVQSDEEHDGATWRYKYSGDWATDGKDGWQAEYEVNETPMTAAQLAAINSGITAAEVQRLAGLTDKVFVAEYGVTTWEELARAMTYKEIICWRLIHTYGNAHFAGDSDVVLTCATQDGVYYLSCSMANVWSSGFVGVEKTANKVTSLSASSTNSQYPGAKAVYDALQLVNKVFIAEYGVTTYAEIVSKINAGAMVFCAYGLYTYMITQYNEESGVIYFTSMWTNPAIKWIRVVRNDAWAGGQYLVEQTSNRQTTIPDNPDDTHYPTSKATYDAINPAKQSAIPAGGMLPNVLYNLGELSGAVSMALATPADANIGNHYFFTFETGATAPTITWDAKITSWMGGSAPTINASKHYEVSVLNGVGVIMEV